MEQQPNLSNRITNSSRILDRSKISHKHIRSTMACFIYIMLAEML